jgi:hypothetical protein
MESSRSKIATCAPNLASFSVVARPRPERLTGKSARLSPLSSEDAYPPVTTHILLPSFIISDSKITKI